MAEEIKETATEVVTEAAEKIAEPAPPEKRAVLWQMGGLRALDAAVFLAVNHLPHSQDANDMVETISDLGKGAGWITAAALLALGRARGGWRAAFLTAAAMLTATGLTQGPIKSYFLRQRPWAVLAEDIVIGKRTSDSSFPSGHTAGSFAAALAMADGYPDQLPLLLLLAAAVGFSRIYLGHHYPSDVLGGACIGCAVGSLATQISDALVRN